MHRLPAYKRILLLTEGRLGVFSSKSAASLLRYRAEDIVGVIDSAAAGRPLREFIPWAPQAPIHPDIAAALPSRPDALFIGIAPVGGQLPAEMRAAVAAAIGAGIDVVSGLHTLLAHDDELAQLARRTGASIHDLRRPPAEQVIASTRARSSRCRRVLTIGSDCNVGKMVAAIELSAAARRAGLDGRFTATGQTGIMIAGAGIAIDAVVADFVAGAVESLVLDASDADVCFLEGQGSIGHPAYSGIMLALLHGACPDAMILVHHLGRTHYKSLATRALPRMSELVGVYEAMAGLLHPARVCGIALNTVDSSESAAREAAAALEAELGIPAADVVRDPGGGDRLLAAALA